MPSRLCRRRAGRRDERRRPSSLTTPIRAARAACVETCVERAGVVELESDKLEAIRSACEVATAVMAVDAIVVDQR